MKLIIAGSRGIKEELALAIISSNIYFKVTEVVSGVCRGVDMAGEHWASDNGIKVTRFPADWDLHGRGAGPIRNRKMAKYADALFIIWDGQSRGSANMIKQAKENNLTIFETVV